VAISNHPALLGTLGESRFTCLILQKMLHDVTQKVQRSISLFVCVTVGTNLTVLARCMMVRKNPVSISAMAISRLHR